MLYPYCYPLTAYCAIYLCRIRCTRRSVSSEEGEGSLSISHLMRTQHRSMATPVQNHPWCSRTYRLSIFPQATRLAWALTPNLNCMGCAPRLVQTCGQLHKTHAAAEFALPACKTGRKIPFELMWICTQGLRYMVKNSSAIG